MPDFFDKIVGGINKGVATVGANSKAMMEKAKVNSAINNIEAQRSQLVNLLGGKIYEMYKLSGEITADESIQNFIAEIDKRHEQIAELQDQLRRIEEEVSLVTGGVAPAANQGGIICSCGQPNSANAKFCAKCGNNMASLPQQGYEPSQSYTPQQEYNPSQGYTPAPQQEYVPQQEYTPQQTYTPQQEYNPSQGYTPQQEYTPSVAPATSPGVCSCGQSNPPNVRFCAGCGNQMP